MASMLCASCKTRVEEGAVRCVSCGAQLDLPGAFTQVLGWVIASIALIPLAISEVTTSERNPYPLILGGIIAVVGISMIVAGKARARSAPPTVIPAEAAPAPPKA